jgi:3-(3-hydroxy-phenyl)propionate hydroxylase
MADVAIVGAGPVGMTAAALLAARGIRVAVMETHSTTSSEPKAISIDDESLRTYADAGIADAVLRILSPGTGTRYFDRDGKPVFQASGPAPYRLGYTFKNPFAQPDLERVLAAALDRSPLVDLLFGATVTGLEQVDDHVVIRAVAATATTTVNARFALGADGGRSTVRQCLGVTMSGRAYPDPWLVVDTLGDPHRERYGMHYGTPERPHVIIPGKDGRCRYEFLLFDGEGMPGETPEQELITRLLAPYRPITAGQVERAVIYRFNALCADRWRVGNVFLVGDAAHMMPPFAGQGLNSGIRDVANLAWKLAGVIHGQLADTILDSYEAERKPHAIASIRLSEKLGRTVMTTSPRMAAARDRLIRAALAATEGRTYFEEMRYRPSAAIRCGLLASGAEEVGRPIAQPRGFEMTACEVRYLDQVTGTGWSVLGVGATEEAWYEAAEVINLVHAAAVHICPDDVLPDRVPDWTRVVVDVDEGIRGEFGRHSGSFLLIRPDHVIAAAWRPGGAARVAGAVQGWVNELRGHADALPRHIWPGWDAGGSRGPR